MKGKSKTGNSKILIITGILGVAGLGIWFASRAKRLSSLIVDIDVASIDKSQTNLKQTSLKLAVNIYNPNEIGIPFKKFIGNLYYNNKLIANIDPYTNSSIMIKGRQNTIIPLRVNIPNANLGISLLNTVLDLLGKTIETIPMKLVGYLEAGELSVPVNKDLSIDLAA